MCPLFKTSVTPRATPIINATLNKLSAPLMNWSRNFFSLTRSIKAIRMAEA